MPTHVSHLPPHYPGYLCDALTEHPSLMVWQRHFHLERVSVVMLWSVPDRHLKLRMFVISSNVRVDWHSGFVVSVNFDYVQIVENAVCELTLLYLYFESAACCNFAK